MRYIRAIGVILAIAIILPQTLTVWQMGMGAIHNSNQQSASSAENCQNSLPCLSAHQPAIPPAVDVLGRFFIVLVILAIAASGVLLVPQRDWGARYRHQIRQCLYNRMGLHMHAFDPLRSWISRGMLTQKTTNIIV